MARNKYEGKCYRCGETVKPGDGYYERHNGKFRVQHVKCCKEARTAQRQGSEG